MAKEALQKIDGRKRERIFKVAAAEFARFGYHKANVNSIAQRAGIGKGSIYLYFADKRDLYYSTFKEAVLIQERLFDSIAQMNLGPVRKIEEVFQQSLKVFPQFRNMFKMYFDVSASGNDRSLAGIAQLMERKSADFFTSILLDGIQEGSIRKNLPVRYAAYVLDSVYTTFFSSLACSYQSARFRVFVQKELSKDVKDINEHIDFILNVLESGIGTLENGTEEINPAGIAMRRKL